MKILSASQVKEADQYTIKHEPISSINLMERAAERIAQSLQQDYPGAVFHIFCGKGNNGGDGLAVARLLHQQNIPLSVY
ncbi:MAG: NAD(P)H-hydrate epimerase, partial [Owenweeksia sp.]